jgi:hypothetical protein
MTANIGKIIKTPEARMNILKSAESNRIQAQMKSYNGVEIPETTGLRWSHDGK